MNIRYLLVAIAALMITACNTASEIVSAGKDTYLVVGNGNVLEISGAAQLPDLYKKANVHCETMGKKLLPVNQSTSSYTAELRFRCLEEDDPEYVRPNMESVPNVRIETK